MFCQAGASSSSVGGSNTATTLQPLPGLDGLVDDVGAGEHGGGILVARVAGATHPGSCAPVQVVLQPGEGGEGIGANLVAADEPPEAKRRRGLSPYMMYKNRMVAAARAAAGRPLTDKERQELSEQAQKAWGAMTEKSAHIELYHEWQMTPKTPATATPEKPFHPQWCGGCRACPVSATELCEYFRANGWPTDAEVHHDKDEHVPCSREVDWAQSQAYDLWGCHRRAMNICQTEVGGLASFAIVHKGLCNFAEHLSRDVAESGAVLFIVEGKTSEDPPIVKRFVCTLAGTCWSPIVFDVVEHQFEDQRQSSAASLDFPCDVRVSCRPSRVSDRYECVAVETSAMLTRRIVASVSSAVLFQADYHVLLVDGTLMSSRITGLKLIGDLLKPGATHPLLASEVAAKKKAARKESATAKLIQGDPFARAAAEAGKANRKAPARGRGGGGRRARGRGRANAAAEQGEPVDIVAYAPGVSSGSGEGNAAAQLGMNLEEVGHAFGGVDLGSQEELFVPFGQDYDDIDFEAELGQIMQSDEDELGATFGAGDGLGDEQRARDGATGPEDVGTPHGSLLVEIVGAADAAAELTGLDGDTPAVAGDEACATGPPNDELGATMSDFAPPPPPVPARNCVGPSALGYVTLDGRAVMRIQRGNPKSSLSVRCYRHSGCSFLLPLRMAPSDAELIEWCFAVPTAETGASAAEARELARRHVELSRLWRAASTGASSSSVPPCGNVDIAGSAA